MLTRCKKRRRKKQAFRRIYLQRGTNNTWCLCGEYNSISSKTFLINAQVDASPFSWEEISNILTGMRRMYRFNSPSRNRTDPIDFLSGQKRKGEEPTSRRAFHPSHCYSRYLWKKSADNLAIRKFVFRTLSFFLSRPIARTDKIGEKRKTSEGGNGRQRARVRRVSHSRLIAARRNKIGSSRWQQVIGAGIDAKLVKPGCVSPSKRG